MRYGAFCVICPRASSQYVTPLLSLSRGRHCSSHDGVCALWVLLFATTLVQFSCVWLTRWRVLFRSTASTRSTRRGSWTSRSSRRSSSTRSSALSFTTSTSFQRMTAICTRVRRSRATCPSPLTKWATSTYPKESVYERLCPKKGSHLMFDNTLANVDRFSKFFHQLIREKIFYEHIKTSPHLRYVATLHCESRESKNVADFDSILNELLTCSWGHCEHLI